MSKINFIQVAIQAIASSLICLVSVIATASANDSPENPNDVRSLFPLNDSEWSSMKVVDDVKRMPKEPIALMLYRLKQRHIEDSLRERVVPLEKLASLAQGSVVEQTESVFVRKITPCKSNMQHIEPAFKSYYICDLNVAEQGDAVCVTLRVPRAWLDSTSSNKDGSICFDKPKRTGFLGVLVTPGNEPVFVTPRLQDRSDSLLNRHGMDVSLLDDVTPIPVNDLKSGNASSRKLQALKFTAADFEPFYRMLVAASSVRPSDVDMEISTNSRNKTVSNESVVRDFFNRPESQQGRLVRLSGYARRIKRFSVTDQEAVKRFGVDHYYQIALFTEESQGNPIMICMAELPDGLPIGEGKAFNVPMSVSAFFYKIWAYEKKESEFNNEKSGRSNTQFAPLLIGTKVDWFRLHADERTNGDAKGFQSSCIGVFILFVLAWSAFRLVCPRSSDVRFQLIPMKNVPLTDTEERIETVSKTQRHDSFPEIVPIKKTKR